MTPLIKNVSIGAGGVAVAVAIYLVGGASANKYSGAILTHLVDIVQGNSTKTVLALNAPAWALGEPLSAAINSSIATSSLANATSGLASSTPYTFQIAALDGQGTTTLGEAQTVTTDPS